MAFDQDRNRDRGRDRDRERSDAPSRSASRRLAELGPGGRDAVKVSYKEVDILRKLLSSSAKMISRRRSGTNSQEQSGIRRAIKQARFLALLPYTGT